MRTNVTQIRQDDPPHADGKQADPLRANLDAAQKMAWKYTCAVTSAAEALRRGGELVREAEAAVAATTSAVDEARQHDAKTAAKAIRQRDAVAGGAGATKKARRDLEDAEDAAEVARSALATLESDLADAESKATWRTQAVIVARNAVLGQLARELIDQARMQRLLLARSKSALAELFHGAEQGWPEFDDALERIRAAEAARAPLAELRAETERLLMAGTNDEERAAAGVVAGQVKAYIAALTASSAAEPPAVMG